MSKHPSLLDHAAKRYRLAGGNLLEELPFNPWFVAIDDLRKDLASRDKPLVSFANYDYLGLAQHEAVKEAAAEALEKFGAGALGSRLVGGERSIHAEFEQDIADFFGAEACIALVSGYLANVSVIPHLLGARDLLIMDDLCHNSIVTGSKGTKATQMMFRHNDLEHLEAILEERRDSHRNCLIVVEGLYSMDGDLPDLPRLLDLKDKYGAWLLIDEAHSFGVLGDSGRGIAEHFGEDPSRIDIIVGTLSKSLVSCGGFLCARKPVIDWLRYTLAGFVYSVGLSPVITASAHAALKLIVAQPQRTARLRLLSELFLQKARAAGLDTGSAVGRGIVPVMFEDMHTTMAASEALLRAGIFAPPIVHVGVPKDAPRIRFFLSAKHEAHQFDTVMSVLRSVIRNESLSELDVAL